MTVANKIAGENIPALRFPEFEGTWVETRIGELCSTFKSGLGITSGSIKETGEYPVYGGNGLRGYTDNYTHDGFYFLIGRQGALCGNINRSFGKSYISEHAIAVQGGEYSDTEWLAQRLDHYNLNRLSESSAQPGLSVNKLVRFKLQVPVKAEQKKIADFLTAVDEKIGGLSKKKDLLEQYKKGVMQKLFSQQIRFTDDHGNPYPDWEEKKLGDIYDFIITNSLSRSSLNYETGGIYNIHYGDIHTKFQVEFKLNEESVPYINSDKNTSKITNEQFCKVKDIVIADASEDYSDIGKSIEIVNTSGKNIVAGLHTHHARPKDEAKVALGFSGRLMQSWDIRYQVMRLAVGSKVLGISKTNIKKIDVKLPHPDEQQKIADFLSSLDQKIDHTTNQLDQAKSFKKGLLQQMFV